MRAIILPIRNEYIQRIFSGEKKYEFRKCLCSQPIDTIFLYETAPTMKIVGCVSVVRKLRDKKEVMWEKCFPYAGICKEDFEHYFRKNEYACAYELSSPHCFDIPINKEDLGIKHSIQSFAYIDSTTLLEKTAIVK